MQFTRSLIAGLLLLTATSLPLRAQNLTLPPSGDNQKASVTQGIGPVRVTVDYSSPDVHAPDGTDRRGKIWGQLVPWGTTNLGIGTCTECPWRVGANENTTFTTTHDVLVQGQPLPAGRYGLHMIPQQDEWTVIFSRDADSWGSYHYDPANDALRVTAKPAASEYNEWLTFEFTDRRPDRATLAFKWEELQLPLTIEVPEIANVYLAEIRKELKGSAGFSSQNLLTAARFALRSGAPEEALSWATTAVRGNYVGAENFQTLSTLADAQEANGMKAEAAATRKQALNHRSAGPGDLHQYARTLLAQGKTAEALEVWQLNARRFKDEWPVHVGLARGYSAAGRYKEALKHAKLALAQAPDEMNRRSLETAIERLGRGEDFNR